MPVLGLGGRLRLRREAPEPVVLHPDALSTSSNTLYVRNPAFWSGDAVTLDGVEGLPIDTDGSGPDAPNGYASYYGSRWKLGSNRSHITQHNDKFYAGDNAPFYMRRQECGLTSHATYYIYRDQLDQVSFYTDRTAALRGDPARRVPLHAIDFQTLVMAPRGSANYESAVVRCTRQLGEYGYSDTRDEVTLASICASAPTYESPAAGTAEYDNADLRPRGGVNDPQDGSMWVVQCWLREWSLNLNAPEVDTTAVGDRFGESVKSIITGGGSMDFLVERSNHEGAADTTLLMQLLLMTEKGSKADAEFWMIPERDERECEALPGGLFYETQLLVTSTAVNTRIEEAIAGSLNFVTVGEIALRMGSN